MNDSATRIFREGFPSNEPPRPHVSMGAPALCTVRPSVSVPVEPTPTEASVERQIIQIIESAQPETETTELTFRRKERELRDLFASLSVMESRALHRRLSTAAGNDLLAKSFGRM